MTCCKQRCCCNVIISAVTVRVNVIEWWRSWWLYFLRIHRLELMPKKACLIHPGWFNQFYFRSLISSDSQSVSQYQKWGVMCPVLPVWAWLEIACCKLWKPELSPASLIIPTGLPALMAIFHSFIQELKLNLDNSRSTQEVFTRSSSTSSLE